MDVGLRFMEEHYGFKAEETLSHTNQARILDLTMLSEFQPHGYDQLVSGTVFRYLASPNVMELGRITGEHVHSYLRYISGYSNQTKDHMMRTVRQFMEFCWQNRYHPQNLASFAPNVYYDKRPAVSAS